MAHTKVMAVTHIPSWTLGERLRKAREDAGLAQVDVAREMRIGRSTVANWENGTNKPSYLAVEKLSMMTGVPLWWLLDEPTEAADTRAVTPRYQSRVSLLCAS